MTRGFRNKAGKELDAKIAGLRPGYLSAIAWRRAEWLAARHIERDDAAEVAPVCLGDALERERRERVYSALENRRARELLLDWCPAAAHRAWLGKYGFMGHALPRDVRDSIGWYQAVNESATSRARANAKTPSN